MIDKTRHVAQRYVVLLAAAIGLAATGVARATTSELFVEGNWGFNAAEGAVVLSVDKVSNITVPPRITGELTLELWAFREPYTGLQQAGYQQNGHRLASYPIGRIAPGYYLFDVETPPIPLRQPPPGTWYLTEMIVEYDASAINDGGLLPRAFHNFEPPSSVAAPPSGVAPQSGLWHDPEVPGVIVSIAIQNGQLVAIANAYRADGAPVWYKAAAPLLAGQTIWVGALERFAGGACVVSCDELRFPTLEPPQGAFVIVFLTPGRADATLGIGGRTLHLVPLPIGPS